MKLLKNIFIKCKKKKDKSRFQILIKTAIINNITALWLHFLQTAFDPLLGCNYKVSVRFYQDYFPIILTVLCLSTKVEGVHYTERSRRKKDVFRVESDQIVFNCGFYELCFNAIVAGWFYPVDKAVRFQYRFTLSYAACRILLPQHKNCLVFLPSEEKLY